jgi:hypothetical protein
MNAVKAATPESALMAFPGATPVRSQHAGGAPPGRCGRTEAAAARLRLG